MRDTRELPAPAPDRPHGPAPEAARAAGLRRLSRLTWRATQLSAITAVGFAALFARTAPAQNTASDGTAAPAVSSSSSSSSSSAAPASAPGKTHRKRARTAGSAPARAAARPTPLAVARVTPQTSRTPTAAKSSTLAPPSSAPASAPPTSAAPTPKPTVSSASHGGG